MARNGQTAFDCESLERELGKESVKTLVRMFLEDTCDTVRQVQQAVKDRNAEQVRSLAHMMKGGCRSISALSSAEFCEVLEESAQRADWAAIRIGVNALEPMYESLKNDILSYLNESVRRD
jgi:HPt (histidine-containing phosphotransfer) domain-containing protein